MPPWHRLSAGMAADESSAIYQRNVCHTAWNQQRQAHNRSAWGIYTRTRTSYTALGVNRARDKTCYTQTVRHEYVLLFLFLFLLRPPRNSILFLGCSLSYCQCIEDSSPLRTHSTVGHCWEHGKPSLCVLRSPQPTATCFFPVLAGQKGRHTYSVKPVKLNIRSKANV